MNATLTAAPLQAPPQDHARIPHTRAKPDRPAMFEPTDSRASVPDRIRPSNEHPGRGHGISRNRESLVANSGALANVLSLAGDAEQMTSRINPGANAADDIAEHPAEHTGERLTHRHAATIVSLAGRLIPLRTYAVLHASGLVVTRIPSEFRNSLRRQEIPDGDDCERTALRSFFWALSGTDTARQLYAALTANAPDLAEFADLQTGRIIKATPGNSPRSAVYYLASPGLIVETPEGWMSARQPAFAGDAKQGP